MSNNETIAIYDAETSEEAILNLILQFPGYPESFKATKKNVQWNMLNTDVSIGIFQTSGAVYKRKYIDGSYIGNVPFNIVYRTKTSNTNKSSIESIQVVKDLAAWLTKCDVTYINEHFTLKAINQTSLVIPRSQDEKNIDYIVGMQMEFLYKK